MINNVEFPMPLNISFRIPHFNNKINWGEKKRLIWYGNCFYLQIHTQMPID